jgi:hypothetical protein
MSELHDRYQQQMELATATKNRIQRRDLKKMLVHVDQLLTEISKESVNCRRAKCSTLHYKELVVLCEDQLDVVEKYMLLSRLIGG